MDSLKQSLRIFYQQKADAEQQEFKYKNRFQVLRWIPSVGWDAFRMSPIISINTHSLFAELNRTRERKAKLEGLTKINEVQFNAEITEVTFLLSTLRKKVIFYNDQLDILRLENQRFEIVQKAYDNHEITPTDYLSKLIAYENYKSTLKQLEVELYDLKNKLLIKAKQAPWESLF